ncbi:chemotaxis protein CheV [Helicobacter sp. 12S02232-10]|uniref:chemotaxis protein CheW n=1 Tax=Helicobacter sp. 12S02232-10 TaxID=1476197 RepID=UPI000BA52F23|nr:chemotaxis protein CheW [Helicobacter sp. 12S02232-10]PAF49888.1 chemotaxis protein CheV [Helicobacter sp. 12S02232-10]
MISDIDKTTSLHLNNEVQFLCFTLDEESNSQLYAMNVFKIREIIYYDGEFTETAGENNGIMLGFLTVRGESIPLIDMRRWLYYSPDDPERDLKPYSIQAEKSLVVICNFSNYTVGLKILGVKRIIQKNWSEVSVGSEYGFDGNSKVTATTKYDDGSVIQILDVEKMVADAFPMLDNFSGLELQPIEAINSNKIILLAEDSQFAARSLQKIIEKLELKYFTFPNGKVLLDYLFSSGVIEHIGAVITDLEMPMISGFEVLKRIKESPETKHIPVIVNSSMSSDSNKQMAQTLHADGFITKSNAAEIEELLKKFLA